MEHHFQIGDTVRVKAIPPHINATYPFPETLQAFQFALGKTYSVEEVDWGGWVQLNLGQRHGTIGVQPDCVELVRRGKPQSRA
ncbi:MAG: hypothetical protein ABIR70_13055 [Bryobacteraceae bacterium]